MDTIITEEKKQQIANANRSNPYVDVTPWVLGISYPTVYYSGFHPDADEILLYAASAATYKDKTQTVGYEGRSAGYSVRVTKRISVRSGASSGRPIRETVRQSNAGDLIITSKRVLFIGTDDTFSFPISSISAVKMIDAGSFVILSGSSSKNVSLNSTTITYAYSLIDSLLSLKSQGQDIYSHVRAVQAGVTPDKIALCSQIREECAQKSVSVAKKSQGCFGGCLKYLLIAFVLLMGLGFLLNSCASDTADTSDTISSDATTPQYSSAEILNLDNHPKIYDSLEEVGFFYGNVGGVQLMTTSEYTLAKRDSGTTKEDDDNVLYLLRINSDDDHVGYMEAFIRDDYVASMTVDTAAKLLVSYLPDNFFEYYRKDSSYTKNNGDDLVYVCSYRLNDDGIAYHNNGHDWYSNHYSCYVCHYSDPEYWVISTDYSAYGRMDLGWIQKYGGEWDVDLKDYK